jgi:hypothetical protein
VASSSSAAMCRRQSLRLVATAHHPSGQGGVPPCPRTTRLSRGVRGSCGTRPLRQSYITPHCSQCPPVSRKLLLWQPPLRALRVKATGVMQNCLRWSGRTAVGASRSLARPTRHRLRALVVVVAPGHQSGAARCVAGQWPAASHVVCAPAHPCASPLRGISPARWSARPPPVGAPSARAPLLLGFATGLVAGHARNTGATGLSACKPAWPLAYLSGARQLHSLCI